MTILKKLANKIGLDKAIAYSSGARVVGAFAGVASVFFITSFLSETEQGFYYTFGSLLAMQVFFELGLTGIMTQYVAHEVSHLTLNPSKKYIGEKRYVSRLSSLLHFCVKWYAIIAILVVTFLMYFGNLYFLQYGDTQDEFVEWRIPWLIVCVSTGIKLFQSPFTSIISGLGYVKEISKISFCQQIIIPSCTWLGLVCGFKLYVIGIGYLISVLIWFIFISKMGLLKILVNLWNENITEKVSYVKEIFPFQWKIALSWVSGYFIFNIFNVVLFATDGAVVAGQMGMTLQALNSIQAFAMSWLNTKVPLYSSLIAKHDYNKLDHIFKTTLKQMFSVCILLILAFLLVISILRITQFKINGQVFAERFLEYIPMILMIIPLLLQQFTNSWATYLRCHKAEPFLLFSVVNGILCMLSTIGLGTRFGLYGITLGYCIIQTILFPWGYYIYKTKREQWHGEVRR